MNRPASITTTTAGGVQRWATGVYTSDGAGNIKSMGTHTFAYDKVSKLTAANLYLEPTSSTSLRFQTFSYDAFGNLQSIAGSSARSTPTCSSTNRLTAATCDAQGNVTTWIADSRGEAELAIALLEKGQDFRGRPPRLGGSTSPKANRSRA